MNVWLMNLKDNRDNAEVDGTEKKFKFCKEKNIVGIGWVDYKKNKIKDLGYERAKAAIERFQYGDLVWVKDNVNKKYYICKINDNSNKITEEECNNYDISEYRFCQYYYVGDSDKLPKSINERDLVSISTIRRANEDIANATVDFFKTFTTENKDTSVSPGIKQKTKRTIIIGMTIVFFIVAAIVCSSIFATKKKIKKDLEVNKVISFISGKTYSIELTSEYGNVKNLKENIWYSFSNKNDENIVVADQIICNLNNTKIFAYNEGNSEGTFSVDTDKKRLEINFHSEVPKFYNYQINTDDSIEFTELDIVEKYTPVLNNEVNINEITQTITQIWYTARKSYIDNYKQTYNTSNSLILKNTIMRDQIGGSIGYIGVINIPESFSDEFVSSYSYNANKLYSNKTLDYIIAPAILFLKGIPTAITDEEELINKFKDNTVNKEQGYNYCYFEKDGLKYELSYYDDSSTSSLQNGFSIKIGILNSDFKIGNSEKIQKILTE